MSRTLLTFSPFLLVIEPFSTNVEARVRLVAQSNTPRVGGRGGAGVLTCC
jgi:hypothetical protein